MSEVTATDYVHALVDAGELSIAIADRLDDNGFETIADLLIADKADLTEVPYVGAERADSILAAVDDVDKLAPEPREIDLEETESVVSEAAIPLSVRRGEAVLVGGQRSEKYHTRDCSVVRGHDVSPVTLEHALNRGLTECEGCQDPGLFGRMGSSNRTESNLEPLVDSCEVVLEATLGEKLQVTLAERDAWARPWTVIEAPDPTERESASGGTWMTRRLRLSESASGTAKEARECDLVLVDDEIRIEDPPVKRESHQPGAPGWGVESVGAVGRVSTTSLIQLQADDQTEAKPEGDDTWRKYQNRGETA